MLPGFSDTTSGMRRTTRFPTAKGIPSGYVGEPMTITSGAGRSGVRPRVGSTAGTRMNQLGSASGVGAIVARTAAAASVGRAVGVPDPASSRVIATTATRRPTKPTAGSRQPVPVRVGVSSGLSIGRIVRSRPLLCYDANVARSSPGRLQG
jgi:hypothetical protein